MKNEEYYIIFIFFNIIETVIKSDEIRSVLKILKSKRIILKVEKNFISYIIY